PVAPLFPLPAMVGGEHVNALGIQHVGCHENTRALNTYCTCLSCVRASWRPWRCESESELSQVFPVPTRARRRRPHRRQHALLDDDPAGVAETAKQVQSFCKLDDAAPEFAEEASPNRGEVVELFLLHGPHDRWIAILEVDVPDAAAVVLDHVDRVGMA